MTRAGTRVARLAAAAVGVAVAASAASGQLMVLDNLNGRIMLFSDIDGSLIDANWITEAGAVGWELPSQPQAVEMVGDEIWVSGSWFSEGFEGVLRLDQEGNFLGRFATEGQPYGISTNGTNALVAIDPGSGIFTLDGVEVGIVYTLRAYDIEYYQGGMIAGSVQNGALELFDALGNYIGDFATDLAYPSQIVVQPDDSVIVTNYLTFPQVELQGVYHYNADGTIRTFVGTGTVGTGFFGVTPRGAVQLENGNYLITDSSGVYIAAADGAGGHAVTSVFSDANAFQIGTFTGTLPPQCACETDGNAAQVDVFDLLAYLDLWFAGDSAAELDGTAGVDVFDLLSFLDCWFPASAGEPC